MQSAPSSREDAGGKGITVARVVAAAGIPTLAVLPLAGDDPFVALLRSAAVPARPVAIRGHARANLTITDPAGVTTKLNLPGATLRAEEAEALGAAVVDACAGASWLVLAGSLPPGVGDDFYVTVIRAVRERWGEAAPHVAVDTSGEALRRVVADAHPDLIKPNDDELAELSGVALDPGDVERSVLRVARTLVPGRVGAALITLGSRGSVLVRPSGGYVAAARASECRTPSGPGTAPWPVTCWPTSPERPLPSGSPAPSATAPPRRSPEPRPRVPRT